MTKKPKSVNILGVDYSIEYVDNPAEVDIYKRKSLWGQIDYWTRTIRVYDNDRPAKDIWDTILHEILHGIAEELNLKSFRDSDNHDELETISITLMDTLVRNSWLEIETEEI